MSRKISLYIEDMLASISKISDYITGMNYDDFESNGLVVDAVTRNLEIIGEATKRIPDTIRDTYPAIPWKSIIGLRNTVLHEYLGIDKEIIYKIITEDFRKTEIELKKCLTYLKSIEK